MAKSSPSPRSSPASGQGSLSKSLRNIHAGLDKKPGAGPGFWSTIVQLFVRGIRQRRHQGVQGALAILHHTDYVAHRADGHLGAVDDPALGRRPAPHLGKKRKKIRVAGHHAPIPLGKFRQSFHPVRWHHSYRIHDRAIILKTAYGNDSIQNQQFFQRHPELPQSWQA